MAVQTRLLFAGLVVLIFFSLNLGIHDWGSQSRAKSFAELQNAVERQLHIAEIERRLSEAHREIALQAAGILGQGPAPVSPQARAAFAARLRQIGDEIARERAIPGSATPTANRFAEAWRDLRLSWLRAYDSFGVDNERAIAELSLRADPLSRQMLTRLLPRWEQEEGQRAQDASGELRRISDLMDEVEILFFVLSTLVVALVATSVCRFLVFLTRPLEERVRERTQALEQEVQERRKAEAALRQSEERYALAAQGANDGLWDWDLEKNELYLSPRWKEMLGYGESELTGSPHEWFERVHRKDLPRLQQALGTHSAASASQFECEHRMRHQDGSYRWMLINDSLGHSCGDEALITVARTLEASVRPGDTVARLGGDEFAILLDDVRHLTDVKRLTERIEDRLAAPHHVDGSEIYTSASIGIAF